MLPTNSLIDYIAISGTMERNVLEFVDHLHEHFLNPCSINARGRYNVPDKADEGYRWAEQDFFLDQLLVYFLLAILELSFLPFCFTLCLLYLNHNFFGLFLTTYMGLISSSYSCILMSIPNPVSASRCTKTA